MDPATLARIRKRLRHDLRSPLAVIVGRADILLSEIHGAVTPDQRRSLDEIVRHALRMSDELGELAELLDAPAPDAEPVPPAGDAPKPGSEPS